MYRNICLIGHTPVKFAVPLNLDLPMNDPRCGPQPTKARCYCVQFNLFPATKGLASLFACHVSTTMAVKHKV